MHMNMPFANSLIITILNSESQNCLRQIRKSGTTTTNNTATSKVQLNVQLTSADAPSIGNILGQRNSNGLPTTSDTEEKLMARQLRNAENTTSFYKTQAYPPYTDHSTTTEVE
jgi:hypothetical protein